MVSTENQPVANTDVTITPKVPGCLTLTSSRGAKTDGQGRFSVTGLMPGKAEVSVGGDYQIVEPQDIDVPLRSAIKITVRRPQEKAAVSVTGRVVTADGKPTGGAIVKVRIESPMPGEMITVDERQVTTNAQGTFKLASLPPKAKVESVSASKNGFAFVFGGQTSAKAGIVTVSDIVLSPLTRTVRGLVMDAAGRPAAGALVNTLSTDRSPVTTDASGGFLLDRLPETDAVIAAAMGGEYGSATSKSDAVVNIRMAENSAASPGDAAQGYAVLEDVLKQSRGTSYYARPAVPVELAVQDPDLAVKLAASDAGPMDRTVAGVISTLVQLKNPRALEWGVPKLGEITDPHLDICSMAALGIMAARSEPATAADLLARASRSLPFSSSPDETITDSVWLAALAERLGDARADAYLDKLLQAMKGNDTNRMGAAVAEIAALGSPRLADNLISALPEAQRGEARFRAVTELSGYDPAGAREELTRLADTNTDTEASAYGRSAKYVVEATGKDDPAKALSIAESIKHGGSKALALAMAARFQDHKTAARLLRKAEELAGRDPDSVRELPEIAAIAYDIDREIGAGIFKQARAALGEHTNLVPEFSYYYARADAAQARLLLESITLTSECLRLRTPGVK